MKQTRHLLATVFLFVFFINSIFSQEVTQVAAERLVTTVIQRNAGTALKNARNLQVTERFTKKMDEQASFHIFNLQPAGFVIIAADDRYHPVLAFSDESNIDLNNKETYVGLWGTLSYHESRIQYLRANNIPATKAIRNEWTTLNNRNTSAPRRGIVVAPLTTTKWNQGQYYNAECPADETTATTGPDGRTYCGCGPVAMAQLIKFHNYPINGNGSNTYIDPVFGSQTADFCNTTYNWSNMPDILTESNADVANLIYHMGVATNTYYSTEYTETYLSFMRNAFVNYFGFDQAANWFYDSKGDFHWVAKNDLDRGRPLLLSGVSIYGGAHTWVADGYGYFDASGGEGDTEYFHFNWGWGGDNNGWFLDTDESWAPRKDVPDNVEITYYFDRYVIQNLFPARERCQAPERIYTSGIEGDYAYLNVSYANGTQDISFRYREKGATEWQETPPTNDYYQLITALKIGTEYEYQARRKCCPSDWSDYSVTQTFASAGFVPCTPLPASALSADATLDNATYVYTVQPFGAVENQFRYRPVEAADWLYTDNSTNYYRYLTGLLAGTTYEVQVSQLCSNGSFTDFSPSFYFETTGINDGGMEGGEGNSEENPNCASIDATALTTSSTTETYTYIYTPQPFGAVNNQFRYRPKGAAAWIETDISTTYYRFLANLRTGTTYEFQVRQECSIDNWSAYSDAGTFTTMGEAATDIVEEGDTGEMESNSDCDPVSGLDLYTSSVGNHNAYVYTPQPLGAINNQFRYRPVGTEEWTLTDIATLYYRYLSDLQVETSYEFQVRQECLTDNWASYSESAYFTTTGSTINSKIVVPLSLTELGQRNPNYTTVKSLQISLFPNPTTTTLVLNWNQSLLEAGTIMVLDQIGRQLKNATVKRGVQQYRLNVNDLQAGVYILQVRTKNTRTVSKFIKH